MTSTLLLGFGVLLGSLVLLRGLWLLLSKRPACDVPIRFPAGTFPAKRPATGRLRNSPLGQSFDATRRPLEVRGLSKTEAEDLLDWLEANHRGPAELSYAPDGFAVRCP
jgi:hypothetical protein